MASPNILSPSSASELISMSRTTMPKGLTLIQKGLYSVTKACNHIQELHKNLQIAPKNITMQRIQLTVYSKSNEQRRPKFILESNRGSRSAVVMSYL